MKKRGFTLVELLAVLSILGALALLITPVIFQSVSKFETGAYEKQIKIIEVAATNFASDYLKQMPTKIGQHIYITIGDLKAEGYLDKNLKNPLTDQAFPNDSIIKIIRKKNDFKVKYDDTTGTTSNNSNLKEINAPVITLSGDKIIKLNVGDGYIEPGVKGSVNGVVISYKKYNKSVTISDLNNKGIYTVYYSLTNNGITQVVTRNVIVGDYVPTCNIDYVIGQTVNGVIWNGSGLYKSNNDFPTYSTNQIITLVGSFSGDVTINFKGMDGYTFYPSDNVEIAGETVTAKTYSDGKTNSISFTVLENTSSVNYNLYYSGSGAKVGDYILELSCEN